MKTPLVAGLIAVILLGVVIMTRQTNVQVNVPDQKPVQVGAVSGPDIDSTYLSVNGVTTEYRAQRMAQSTTTVCALRAPTNATSTVKVGNINFAVSSTSASTVTVAKATTAFATTTLIRTVSVGASSPATFPVASSTSAASTAAQALDQTNMTFAPGEYLVVSMAGNPGAYSPTGSCRVEFLSTI